MNRLGRLIGAAMVLSVLVTPRTVSVQSDGEPKKPARAA